jgi:hypothetical protein
MRRTSDETAVLIALLVLRSQQKRARISEKTIRKLAKRRRLRVAFLAELKNDLEDRALVMIELDDGSWGLMPSRGLQGAPTIIAKNLLAADLQKLKAHPTKETWDKFRNELEDDEGIDDDDG